MYWLKILKYETVIVNAAGVFEAVTFSDNVGYEDIVAATCDDRFSPIDNNFLSQVCIVASLPYLTIRSEQTFV